jgi:ATP-dependent DNA helicase DinG
MGRSNYLCLNRARESSLADGTVFTTVDALERGILRLSTGERSDVEYVLNRKLDDKTWNKINGTTESCASYKCEDADCFAARARTKALESDIVVVNHKILAIDFDLKTRMGIESGMFGGVSTIVVDEAHKLEDVLADHWSIKISEFELSDNLDKVLQALLVGESIMSVPEYLDYGDAYKVVTNFFSVTKKFFSLIAKSRREDWADMKNPFCMQFISDPSNDLRSHMKLFEELGPVVFEKLVEQTKYAKDYLQRAIIIATSDDSDLFLTKNDIKVMRRASSSIDWLIEAAEIMDKAMNSKDGIIRQGDITYGVTIEGWINHNSKEVMTIRANAIDVASRASRIWESVNSSILISATLKDLTTGNFKYFERSVGVRNCEEIIVKSPFSMDEQQLVYVSPQTYPPEDGTVFSVEEIVDTVTASQGRSLILFTSRRDIRMAEQELNRYKAAGRFPYTMYVQRPDVDKIQLVDDFKADTYSVLLGLKSMFTGIDIPGESLSNVIICRFPLSQYSAECKMKIKYWKENGFPNWYTRDSLTVFQQAAGRLIRSETCTGVVSILDQRVSTMNSPVFKTAKVGIDALGSRVTLDVNDIATHLSGAKVG